MRMSEYRPASGTGATHQSGCDSKRRHGMIRRMVFRDASLSDCDAVARLHALSWRSAYRGILAQDFLDKFADDDRLRVWRSRLPASQQGRQLVRLAVEESQLVGFVCVFLDEDDRWGALVDNLHVHPGCKGRGIGRRLMTQAASWVIDRRPASALHLWVFENNHAAKGFYERLGGIAVERVVHTATDGNEIPAMRYVWESPAQLAQKP
jgi:ribosomal protein S18 acetylase RimI-like enzyme